MGKDRIAPQPAAIRGRPARCRWANAAIVLVLLVLPLLASVAQAQDWRYRVRPGDTIWELARVHLRADIPWQRLQTLNEVEDPWNMPPGTELRFPVTWLRVQPVKAQVMALQGTVSAYPADTPDRAEAVRIDMRLGAGTALRTEADANLTLAFADGSRLQLHGDSELRLDRLSAWGATGMVDTRLRLTRGRTTNSVKPARGPASRFVLDTPGTMATVRGTSFRVGHGNQRTRAEVLDGSVQVSAGGHSQMLRGGQGSVSEAGGPQPPTPLLPAPDLSAWPATIDQVTTAVAWESVAGADGYRLQVAPDPEFLTFVLDTLVRGPQTTLVVPGDGVFHARVRAVDAHGLEGHDAVTSFQARAHPAPPFAISPAQDAATPGPRPRFRWTRSDGAARYFLQVAATPEFSEPVFEADDLGREDLRMPSELVPGDYYWRVAAADASGRQGPWGDPIGFTLGPAEAGPEIGEDGVVRGRRSLELAWPAGTADQRYRLQLSRDPDFSRLEQEILLDENRIFLPDLRPGTWYMRTQLVDSDDYAHPFGPAQSARIGCLACRIAGGAILLLLVL